MDQGVFFMIFTAKRNKKSYKSDTFSVIFFFFYLDAISISVFGQNIPFKN
jgi:hypothetical protein